MVMSRQRSTSAAIVVVDMEYFEQTTPDEGQLYPAERRLLFDTVVARRPNIVFEVGTWKGGGSTLAIASGLTRNNAGYLHTCEPDSQLFEIARQLFAKHPTGMRVILNNVTSETAIRQLLNLKIVPDMLFFDGPELPDVAINDLMALEPVLCHGSLFAMHDWLNTDSKKCDLIKPYIESSKKWQIVELLRPPHSVGLIMAQFIG
jgi:predicted O-methyltransferase YrrM